MNSLYLNKPKKSHKGKNVIIVILIIIIIGLLYILYANVDELKKENKDYKSQIKELKNNQKENTNDFVDTVESKALMNFLTSNKIRTIISSIGNDKTIDFTNQKVDTNMIEAIISFNNSSDGVTSDTINHYLKAYNLSLTEYPDIICTVDNNVLYKYDNTTKSYKLTGNHAHGGRSFSTTPIYIKAIDLKQSNDTYTLTVNEVYADETNHGFISADPDGKVEVMKFDGYLEQGITNTSKVIYDYENNYKDDNKYPKYKYTFKKDSSGNFVLTKYEKI